MVPLYNDLQSIGYRNIRAKNIKKSLSFYGFIKQPYCRFRPSLSFFFKKNKKVSVVVVGVLKKQ